MRKKREELPEIDFSLVSKEEVTSSHRRWFARGDVDDYELDRTWPTVPEIRSMDNWVLGALDTSILVHCVWILALALVLLS